jgi:hypothetical protein
VAEGQKPPASAAAAAAASTTTTSRAFPFNYRANVVDRDQVVVPAGWDSRGKIRVLREGFDCEAVQRGWTADMEGLDDEGAGETDDQRGSGKSGIGSAIRLWEDTIINLEAEDRVCVRSYLAETDSKININKQPVSLAHSRVDTVDEQVFLRSHYEALQKENAKDPRAQFQQRSVSGEASGVVGPMGSTSLSLPSVERALERDSGDDLTARLGRMGRKVTFSFDLILRVRVSDHGHGFVGAAADVDARPCRINFTLYAADVASYLDDTSTTITGGWRSSRRVRRGIIWRSSKRFERSLGKLLPESAVSAQGCYWRRCRWCRWCRCWWWWWARRERAAARGAEHEPGKFWTRRE